MGEERYQIRDQKGILLGWGELCAGLYDSGRKSDPSELHSRVCVTDQRGIGGLSWFREETWSAYIIT